MNILIIEDDRLLEKALELRLKDIGHKVFLAEDGKQALDAFGSYSHLEVLICDVLMPELSGPSFLWEMRKLIKNEHICVIMMSALSDGESFLKKLEVNYDYYLSKPFMFLELNDILNEIELKKAGAVI
jgi:DNA-binding response OmpR family regulator